MAEWMENVEKAISRIMADKVYTSAEFKRERDTFNSLCKDLERTEVKKWLAQILEILMAERAKDQKKKEHDQLDALIKKHEELIPNVQKTAVMVDLYWKCYAYGDELKPHVEFLDGIMLSSTRDIAPSCLENVDELIERQEEQEPQQGKEEQEQGQEWPLLNWKAGRRRRRRFLGVFEETSERGFVTESRCKCVRLFINNGLIVRRLNWYTPM